MPEDPSASGYPSAAAAPGGVRRPSPGSVRVAVIDCDSGFLRVVTKRIEAMGWPYELLASPVGPDELVPLQVNCLVVDPALFGPQAWGFLECVCEQLPGLGVIVCTQHSTVAERVRGLRIGADDWIGKPCHPEEVIARVEAIVRRRRRAQPPHDARTLLTGELEIRDAQFQAFAAGRSLELTRREFELLQLLAEARGRVLQREHVYQRVWGYAMARGDRSVDVFVRKVRQKLDAASPGWRYIHTHFGVGYRFDPEPKESGGQDAGATPARRDADRTRDPTRGASELPSPA